MGKPIKLIWRLRGKLIVNFISTRGSQIYSIDEVLAKGIADDGGLFVPKLLPKIKLEDLSSSMTLAAVSYTHLTLPTILLV